MAKIANVFLIFLNSSSYKSPLEEYYPKPVPNPDSLIIALRKNGKMLVLTKILFLAISPIFAMEISYIKMHWWGRLLTSGIFQTRLLPHVIVFNLKSAWSML